MKKRVVLVLMAAMLVVGVTACGSKDAGKKEEAKTEQKATGEIGTVSIDDLNTTDTQVIDIREEEQYIGWETEDGKGPCPRSFLWSTWACSACWELSSSCWGPWASRLVPCCTCRTSVPELTAPCWRDRCRGFFLRCGTKRPAFSPGNTGPSARQLQLDSARQTALQDTTRARSSVG